VRAVLLSIRTAAYDEPWAILVAVGRIVTMGRTGARSAVSRAYYGVFHLAREIVETATGERYGNATLHNLIPQFIQSAKHPDGYIAAGHIADLHSDRIRADYRLAANSTEKREYAMAKVRDRRTSAAAA
jgi:hypothetical protein